MNTSLAAIQYRMLLLIMLGCMASQINHNLNSEDPNIQLQQSEINIGYLYMFCNIFLGAFSSVFCEKFLKQDKNDLNLQNTLLYSWGVVFASLSLLYRNSGTKGMNGLFQGHSALSFILICSYAFSGIAVSAVLKLTDSFTKTFISIGSTFFVTFTSALFLGESLRVLHVIGCVVVGIALDVYQDFM